MNDIEQKIVELAAQVQLSESELVEHLAHAQGWDGKYRSIMLLGKKLARFEQDLKTEESTVAGCESTVWLHYCWQEQNLCLALSSDSKIVRGLLYIIAVLFNGKTREEIQQLDQEAWFTQLGIKQHLSESRNNGITAIIKKIKAL